MIYDVCIIGGGISGLYIAYLLVTKNITNNILIIEKEQILGGRIHTISKNFKGKHILYEAGAGIICTSHKLMIQLLQELDLYKYLVDKKGKTIYHLRNSIYIPSNNLHNTPYNLPDDIINLTKGQLVKNTYTTLKTLPKKVLLNNTFISVANMSINHETYKFIKDTYGYDSEFTTSNAYDALRILTKYANTNAKYMKLECGIIEICNRIKQIITKKGVIIKTNTELVSMKYKDDIYTIYCKSVNDDISSKIIKFRARNLALSIPREGLLKINELNSIHNILNSVAPVPFNRIYAVYPLNKNGKVWFDDIDKVITDNVIRIIEPIDKDKGLIMISYTHSEYANIWNNSTKSFTLEDFISFQLSQIFPDKNIPRPVYIKNYYWPAGVHYWKLGFNSHKLGPAIIKPFKEKPLYISGETYSMTQGWIEGALETAKKVVMHIKHNI